jgi:eukaryotic-like serine/threonine-protein kinase
VADSADPRLRQVEEWLDTLPAGATARDRAGETIVPRDQRPDSMRALAALRQLAGESGVRASARLALERTLGEGGMGVVRLATQQTLGRKVAVKGLKPGHRDDRIIMHLLREAWVTGGLEHPNVVPVYDIEIDGDGIPVIVLKRIEGVQWSELMFDAGAVRDRFGAEDLLSWNLEILLQVANAVRFAHTRGIIHRDLKPDNVMIGEFGEVYLLDWGIAVSLKDDGSGRLPLVSEATEMAGTLCYMAPEMLGGGALSERTDIYLLGAVLHEIITGDPPHLGDNPMQLVHSITAPEPPDPVGAPAPLAAICRRAMDPDPDGRFERTEQFRLALKGYLQHRGAERLVERADRRRAELEAALAASDDSPEHRRELYRLYGESRFGYREALAQWPTLDRARAGLDEAARAMAGNELGRGQPRAAITLLAEVEAPSPEVRALLAEATAAEAREAERVAGLEQLARQHDLRVGTRTRFFLVGVLGLIWSVVPFVRHVYFPNTLQSNAFMIAFTCGLIGLVTGFGIWARDTLSRTANNRAMVVAVLAMALGQLLMFCGAALMDLPTEQSHAFMMLVWTMAAVIATVFVDRRLAPSMVGYATAFLVSARWPELTWPAMSLSNAVLMINGLVIWFPRQRRVPVTSQPSPSRR